MTPEAPVPRKFCPRGRPVAHPGDKWRVAPAIYRTRRGEGEGYVAAAEDPMENVSGIAATGETGAP